jgi:hypothetical protein
MSAGNGRPLVRRQADDFWESYGFWPGMAGDGLSPLGPNFGTSEYDDWLPLGPSAGRRDKQDGRNWPVIRGEGDLDRIRWAARIMAELNPVAVGAFEGITDFIVCEGMTFNTVARNTERALDADVLKAIRQVQDVIDTFVEANEYDELQAELVVRSRRDGEFFLRYFEQDEQVIVRPVEPECVTEGGCPLGPEWSLGIRHKVIDDPETGKPIHDVQTPAAYFVRYDYADSGSEIPACEIQHVKVNVDRSIKRGLTDFLCTQDALNGVTKLLRNLREGAAVQAAIAGIREHTTDIAGAQAFQAALRDRIPRPVDPLTGRTRDSQRIVPGTILDVRGAKYIPNPWTNNGGGVHIAIAQAVYRLIGNRWRMPEYMISGDSSNANYSSTLVSGSPFSRWCKRWQKFYKRRFAVPVWKAIELACRLGIIPIPYDVLRTLVDIQVGAPSPDVVNQLEEATIDQGDMDRGVLSKKTRRAHRNLDSEQEAINIKTDPIAAVPGRLTDVDAQGNPINGMAPVGGAPSASPAAAGDSSGSDSGLRATVGGLNAIAALQADYYAGRVPREAAMANAKLLFGFSDPEAASLFPEIAPQKLTPPDAPAGPVPTTEGRDSFFPRLNPRRN